MQAAPPLPLPLSKRPHSPTAASHSQPEKKARLGETNSSARPGPSMMMPPPPPRPAPPAAPMPPIPMAFGRSPAVAAPSGLLTGPLKKPIIMSKPTMGFNIFAKKAPALGGAFALAPEIAAAPKVKPLVPLTPLNPLAAPAPTKPATAPAAAKSVVAEVDPLEAFMNGLAGSMTEAERKAVNGESEAEERRRMADETKKAQEERKDVEMTDAATAAAPPEAATASATTTTIASAERYYGDEDQVDESVIARHNTAAESGLSWLEKQSKIKKKEIKAVDHATMNYAPFRKDFYIESKEIASMSDDAVQAYREGVMEGVKIRGKNCPKPIRSWLHCGLPDRVYAIIQKEHYKAPFPIQQQAIPAIMSGRDIIACAKTGSGKTLAFVLPMLRHVLDQPTVAQGEGPIAIILAPTRELATQIYNECKKFCKPLNLRVVCVYGGASVSDQITQLKRGAEVVVATPGRMIDMLVMNKGGLTNLHRCTYVVLDEADRMFDMGFEPQVFKIVENVRPDRQTVLFSATFPRTIEVLAKKALRNPLEIIIGGRSVASSTITQFVEVRDSASKFPRLLELLGKWYKLDQCILIFVDKQEAVDYLFRQLNDAGYPCAALHGGMDQLDREFTIADFKSKIRTIMVATSIVARGLDVKDLTLVINFSAPNHYEDYVHRVGRTGRAGKAGTAITFVEPDEQKYAPDLVKGLIAAKQVVPKDLQAMADEWAQMRKDGKVQWSSNDGFGSGSGYKFDEAEAAQNFNQRRLLKMADNPDADYEELAAVSEDAKALEDAKQQKKDAASGVTASAAVSATAGPSHPSGLPVPPPVKKGAAAALDPVARQLAVAKQIALAVARTMAQQDKLLIGGDSQTAINADAKVAEAMAKAKEAEEKRQLSFAASALQTKAQALAAQFMGKSAAPAGAITATGGPDDEKRAFSAEVEINDYPQHARWKVTHKGALDAVIDQTECAVTPRGGFVAQGRNPPAGTRKLYLLIEGRNDMDVQQCRAEIVRMLEDAAADSRPENSRYTKYSVI